MLDLKKNSPERHLIVFSGSESWCIEQTISCLAPISNTDQQILWSSTSAPNCLIKQISINSKVVDIEHQLGTEYTGLVINTYQGFNANLFCALAGTIKTPGFIILMTPKFNLWPQLDDQDYQRFISYPYTSKSVKGRYIKYLAKALSTGMRHKQILLLRQTDSRIIALLQTLNQFIATNFSKCQSDNSMHRPQTDIVTSKCFQLLKKNDPYLILICAPRGRGKSASIGNALNNLLKHPAQTKALSILIISQSRSNINTLIDFLTPALEITDKNKNYFKYGQHNLRYMPPDRCLQESAPADIMIIDEAASIPVYQLCQLVKLGKKQVLSTTTDGYEGTGQGFRNQFIKHLIQTKVNYEEINLTTSWRWPKNDRIEDWIQQHLLLKPTQHTQAQLPGKSINIKQLRCVKLNRDSLLKQIGILKQVYSLFADAHYRTMPDDLRFFLDAPDANIWIIQLENLVVAAAISVDEGKLPVELAQQIWLGKRRIQGHLFTQSCINHLGLIEAAALLYRRIIRIAVLPSWQLKGLGKKLLDYISDQSMLNQGDFDGIAVSFSANKNIIGFWFSCNFQAVRLGTQRNARSGNVSLMMMKPLSQQAQRLSSSSGLLLRNSVQLQKQFHPKNDMILANYLKPLTSSADCSNQYKNDIYCFAFAYRQFETCHPALHYYTRQWLTKKKLRNELNPSELELIEQKILHNTDWKKIETHSKIKGKKQNLIKLRSIYARLYNAAWGNKS